jgi:hypothetical protein
MLDEILIHPAVLKISNLALSDEELKELSSSVPKIREIGERLVSLGVPYSLDHGDLYPSNIIMHNGACLVFDWAEASITHPFFSLLPLFRDLPDALLLRKNELLKVYLEQYVFFFFLLLLPLSHFLLHVTFSSDSFDVLCFLFSWMKFQPMETLLEAWRQAEMLGMLLQAVKFWEMVQKIEPNCRHYDQPSVPLWTRFLLEKLKNPKKDVFRK